jgi:hypothetical protein
VSVPAIEGTGAIALNGAGVSGAGAALLRRIAPFLTVLLALVPFTWVAYHNADLPQFGKYQDEGLLLIAGKTLHDSGDYRIASLPGQPYQTKYQPLYPMLLSLLWSVDPKFPEILKALSALQWLLTSGFLLAAFVLFRSFGFVPWKSAAMAGFLATSPWLLYWALLPIADSMFALLVVAVFFLLHKHRDHPQWWWIIGCLGAAACLTKMAGIMMVPAIWAGGWRRPHWKRSLVLTVPMLAIFLSWTVWVDLHRVSSQNPVFLYYTDYSVNLKNHGLGVLPQIVETNLGALIAAAGNCFLFNLADTFPGRFLSVLVLAAWISGSRRIVQRTGTLEYPVFSVLLVLFLLIWPFSPNARLLAPALPLLAMGLCAEAEHLYVLIRHAAASLKTSNRIAAGLLGASLVIGCVVSVALNVNFIVRGIPDFLDGDRGALARDRMTFDWCKRTLPASSVILATNDTYLYLSTGLSAVRPVPNSIAFYQWDLAGQIDNFTHLGRLVDYFGITHVLITPDDFADLEPAQRQSIRATLLSNPRLKKIYSVEGSTIFEVAPVPSFGSLP